VAGGTGRVYLPGEIEAEAAARRRQEGIPLTPDLVADLTETGEKVGQPFPFTA
jgi:LDH2 family malate/lactate/ureidoglycolate dehydrogenase